jgi:hypothetical protein
MKVRKVNMEYPLGPVEYLGFYFEGNQFRGEIVPALHDLLDAGFIRIIDLAVVSKDENGVVTIFEANELSAEVAFALDFLDYEMVGMLSEEDLMTLAEGLPNNTTAAAMLLDHVWAANFAQAVRNANGELVFSERIPHAVVQETRQALLRAADLA